MSFVEYKYETFTDEGRQRLIDAINGDIERDLYDGAAIKVAHRGKIVVDEAMGWADRKNGREQRTNDVFKLLSTTKSFTNVLALQAVDQGRFALTTPIVDIIPEFWGPDPYLRNRRGKVNVTHLFTQTSGIPTTVFPVGGDDLHDMSKVVEAACKLQIINDPGTVLDYSPTINHSLLGELVKRTDPKGRNYNQIVQEELFDKLGMTSTFMGPNLKFNDRLVPFTARTGNEFISDDLLTITTKAIDTPGSEMPFVGGHSSTRDMLLFAEMLRNWGTANGHNFLSPAILTKATRVQSGDLLNGLYSILAGTEDWDIPTANYGLGFNIGGGGIKVSIFGTLNNPQAFGGHGAGTTLWWVDQARELSFVLLTTRAMNEAKNYIRFQRISDLVLSALR